MKKIIYSLVIMIAAGSLFTSCVENTEPQGIRDLREAKADYLASLSKLREADAELVKAQAAYQSAQIAVVEADAALRQALANIAQALADAAQLGVEYLDAELQMKLEADKAAAEIAAVEAQENLAKQQAQLETALRKIAAESIGLTGDESKAITTKTTALNKAYTDYNTALAAKNDAAQKLWQVEYNVATGKDNYETVESYKAKIADEEDKIAEAKAKIATLEDLKKTPSAVKDTIDALKAKQQDLKIEKQNAVNEKNLYEKSVLVEAQREFNDRVTAFKKDSLGNVGEFKFFDVDEKGKEIAVSYELTDGKKVDNIFGNLINNEWLETTDKSTGSGTYYDLRQKGFLYNKDSKAVEVGKAHYGEVSVFADTVQLTEGLDLLDKIVETLNRDMVVVDNLTDSTTVEEAKKAAEKAWKAYTTDRDTLEGGLKDYKPYKDSLAQIAKLAEDTVKAKKAHDDAAAALKTVNTENGKKEAAQIEAVKTTAAAYESAVKDFAAAIAVYGNLKKTTNADSTKFIAAINAFGEAQAAFLGKQDSVKYNKGFDPETGKAVKHTDPLSKLSADKFNLKDENGNPYFTFVGIVEKICQNERIGVDVWNLTEKELLTAVKNPLPKKGEGKTAKDSIEAVKTNPAVAAAIKAFNDYQAVVTKAKHDEDSTKTDFANAKTKFNGYHGEDDAIAAYKKVYMRFWGVSWWDIEKDTVATKFSWTDKTFLEPTNCVYFYNSYSYILKNSTLSTILDNVDPEGYWSSPTEPNWHTIFRSHEWTWTEFAKALIAAQKAEDLGEYVPNKARLDKINAQVAQIREDVEAAIAEYKAATEGLGDVKARFYGVDEDGKILKPKSEKLEEANVAEGKWAFGGYLLEWAEELAPEYPKIVKDYNDTVAKVDQKLKDIEDFITALETAYVAWAKLDDPQLGGAGNLANIIAYFDSLIKTEEDNITAAEKEIKILNEAVAKCEAGYSPAEVEVAYAKAVLAEKERLLKQAEEALARAQKEYDEVIAKYGVRE